MATAEDVIASDETVQKYVFDFLQHHEAPVKVASAILTFYKGNAHDAEALLWGMWGKLAGPFQATENGAMRPNQGSAPCLWLKEVITVIADRREEPKVKRTSRYEMTHEEPATV